MDKAFDLIINYARVSTLEQSENSNALKQQLDRLNNATPEAHHTFFDELSGSRSDRPQYQQCLEMARDASQQGKRVMVRVARLDRWGRDNTEIIRSIEEFDRIGVALYSLDNGYYTVKDAADWLNINIQGIFAQYFLKQLSSNVKRGNDYRRKNKRPICNRPPFGYRLNDNKTALEPDPQQWETAKDMIRAYLYEGVGMGKLAIMSNGGLNRAASVRKWLLNPHIAGDLYWVKGGGGKDDPDRQNREREYIRNAHPALITREEHQLILQKIEENRNRWGKNSYHDPPILSGLVVCGHCGHKMGLQMYKWKGGYRVARCYRSDCQKLGIQEGVIEEAIQEKIAERAEELAQAILEPEPDEKPPELLELERQKEEIINLKKQTGLSTLDASIEEINKKITAFDKPTTIHNDEHLGDMVEAIANTSLWEQMDDKLRRSYYLALVKRVVLKDRAIAEIELNF